MSNAPYQVTFGLLEGWWKYRDASLRISGSPALSEQGWNTVLKASGFEVEFLSNDASYPQRIISGKSDGIISVGLTQSKPVSVRPVKVKQEVVTDS